MHTASIMEGTTPSGIRFLKENKPEPQPPPPPPPSPPIVVSDISEYECAYDALFPPGRSFAAYAECPDKKCKNEDINHHLWDTFMFPASELEERSISPATILKLLAQHNSTTFTSPLLYAIIRKHCFRLNVDGGANRLVTNNLDYMHTSWDINPYTIGGIGDGITCTKKGLFHLICDDGSVLPVSMFTRWKLLKRCYLPRISVSVTPTFTTASGSYPIS